MENHTSKSQDIIKFLCEVGKLKHLARAGWVQLDRNLDNPETVAGHMYRMAVMAMMFSPDEGQTVDKNKLIRMTLIHDMAECIVGDITPLDGISSERKHELEVNAMAYLGSLLPEKTSEEFKSLFNEFESLETIESNIVREFDVFDAMLQAFQYEQRQYQSTGRVTRFQCFFDNAFRIIKSKQLIGMLSEIDKKRTEFWQQIDSKPKYS